MNTPGVVEIRVRVTCYECCGQTIEWFWNGIGRYPTTRTLEKNGWRERRGAWVCPRCARKPVERVQPPGGRRP